MAPSARETVFTREWSPSTAAWWMISLSSHMTDLYSSIATWCWTPQKMQRRIEKCGTVVALCYTFSMSNAVSRFSITARLPDYLLDALDAWRDSQESKPTQNRALEILLCRALGVHVSQNSCQKSRV